MANPATAPDAGTDGQAVATPTGAPATAPATVPDGQGTAQVSSPAGQVAPATPAGGTAPQEPTFFDPKDLAPELLPAYRQMQGTFTKRMQELGAHKEKVAAYDAFMADPVTNLQNLARQYGMNITRAQAQAQLNAQGGQQTDGEWVPQSWQEVITKTQEETRAAILRELAPLLGNVQQLQAQSIEQQLTAIDPEWKLFEPKMRELLKEEPGLSKNIKRLYNLALLEDGVYDARAMKAAQERLKASAGAARMATASTTTSQPAPKKVGNFDDAVEEARRKVASGAKL